MVKTIRMLPNGLRLKYIRGAKKYFLYFGHKRIKIDGENQKGWKAFIDAYSVGTDLKQSATKDMWYSK